MSQDQLISLLLETTTLKRLPRTGWLLRGVPDAESIADHSFGTAFVVLALADVLNASGTLPAPLDAGKALTIAVLHDLPEARLTDLPGPTKHLIPAEVKSQAEAIVIGGAHCGAAVRGTIPGVLARVRGCIDAGGEAGAGRRRGGDDDPMLALRAQRQPRAG